MVGYAKRRMNYTELKPLIKQEFKKRLESEGYLIPAANDARPSFFAVSPPGHSETMHFFLNLVYKDERVIELAKAEVSTESAQFISWEIFKSNFAKLA